MSDRTAVALSVLPGDVQDCLEENFPGTSSFAVEFLNNRGLPMKTARNNAQFRKGMKSHPNAPLRFITPAGETFTISA